MNGYIEGKINLYVDGAMSTINKNGKIIAVNIGSSRVTDRKSNEFIRKDFEDAHTINFYESYAIIMALKYANDNHPNDDIVIWSDSQTAISWMNKGKPGKKTKFKEDIIKIISYWKKFSRASIELKKWDTVNWGENPADFGNK